MFEYESAAFGASPSSSPAMEPKILPPILQSEDGPVQNVLTCTLCCEIPLDPVITPVCQHVFCRSCIEQALQNRQECPNDRQRLQSKQLKEISGALRRIWECVAVRCPKDQCRWTGTMGSYTEHAKNCVSSLEEEHERRIQELKDAHAEQVQEMEAKLVALGERYEENFDRTFERMKQLHEHDIKEAVDMARLQCKKDYEQQLQEVIMRTRRTKYVDRSSNNDSLDCVRVITGMLLQKQPASREQSVTINRTRAIDSCDCAYIVELVKCISQDLKTKPVNVSRDRMFDAVQNCFRAYNWNKTVVAYDYELHLRILLNVCHHTTWFSENQKAKFDQWLEKYNW